MTINLSNYNRICISGSHGIGKTTLAKRIANTFGFIYLMEVARELLENNLSFDWRSTDNIINIFNFEMAILYSHLFLINQSKFISDRSILDIYAYSFYHFQKNKSSLMYSLLEYIENELLFINEKYDCILFYINGYQEKDDQGIFIENAIYKLINDYCLNDKINIFEINKNDIITYNNLSIQI